MSKAKYSKLYDSGLDSETGSTDGTDLSLPVSPRTLTRARLFAPLHIICVVLAISNLIFFTLWASSSNEQCLRPQLVFSPSGYAGALSYERKRLWRSIEPDNPFTGKPRPEHDEAWNKLIEPLVLNINADELSYLPDDGKGSIALRDGSGYIAEPAIYHELHCIKRIRQHLHLDYYYPNGLTEDEKQREGPHIDHCLEYWREAAMCRGDMTLSTFFWNQTFATSRVYSDHECVNWERQDTWARTRMINIQDTNILEKPKIVQ